MPRRSNAPWFAFLVHPRDIDDLKRLRGAAVIRDHSGSEEEFVRRVLSAPPTVIGDVRFGVGPVWGELISVPCLPSDVMRRSGRALVSEAVGVATERGARVIGLGALTAPATRGGVLLVPELRPGITLTTGNSYTAIVARDNVLEACHGMSRPHPLRVAIVGCTGSVGSAASRLLAGRGLDLVLIGRSPARVTAVLPDLVARGAKVGQNLGEAGRADVVLMLTSDAQATLDPNMFDVDVETVVIDVAQPANVRAEDRGLFERQGVRVVQGGLVEAPRFVSTYDFAIRGGGLFACLAETYLFAREGIREHGTGLASVELARRLERAAARHGFAARPLGPRQTPMAPASGRHPSAAVAS